MVRPQDYGVEYAHGLPATVADLDVQERARIENHIEKNLGDLSGSESLDEVRNRVNKVLTDEDLALRK